MKILAFSEYRRVFWVLMVVVVCAVTALFYVRSRAIAQLEAEIRKVQVEQEKWIEENAQLKELWGRKDDLGYLEYLARRELGLIRPGEEKYILVEREP